MTNMKFKYLAMATILALLLVTTADADLSLVWSDEFDGTSLDTANWTIDIGNGCPRSLRLGQQRARVLPGRERHGHRRQPRPHGPRQNPTAAAASPRARSTRRNKQSFLYGRIEMRAKIPTGGGMWPAFWMMPARRRLRRLGRQRRDRHHGSRPTTRPGSAVRSTTAAAGPDNTSPGGTYSLGGANFADEFHVYAVEWEPDEIRWYVDGALFIDEDQLAVVQRRRARQSARALRPGLLHHPERRRRRQLHRLHRPRLHHRGSSPGVPHRLRPGLPGHGQRGADGGHHLAHRRRQSPAGDITITRRLPIPTVLSRRWSSTTARPTWAKTRPRPTPSPGPPSPTDATRSSPRPSTTAAPSSTDTVDITVGAGCGQVPYPRQPRSSCRPGSKPRTSTSAEKALPTTTSDPGNDGNQYRTAKTSTSRSAPTTGGGYNVGWIDRGRMAGIHRGRSRGR